MHQIEEQKRSDQQQNVLHVYLYIYIHTILKVWHFTSALKLES